MKEQRRIQRYPAELKKKALLELAESGNAGAATRHYNVNKQTLYNWKSNLNRSNKKPESNQIRGWRSSLSGAIEIEARKRKA